MSDLVWARNQLKKWRKIQGSAGVFIRGSNSQEEVVITPGSSEWDALMEVFKRAEEEMEKGYAILLRQELERVTNSVTKTVSGGSK